MADLLASGTKAPDFATVDQDGNAVRLQDLVGRPVILYFYPADMTMGCTQEACTFRDELAQFQNLDATILGVSVQDAESHREFRAKNRLNFPLLVDTDKAITRRYGALGLFGVAKRVTYVIGPDGTIEDVFQSMNPKPHVERALRVLREKGSRHGVESSPASGPRPA